MVDMSSQAVTQRLRLMDELWELTVALMNAREVPASERPSETTPAEPSDGDSDTSQNRKRW